MHDPTVMIRRILSVERTRIRGMIVRDQQRRADKGRSQTWDNRVPRGVGTRRERP